MKFFKPTLLSITLGSTLFAGVALADDDYKFLKRDKTKILRAIQIAEARTGGLAQDISRDVESKHRIYWDVEIIQADGSEQEVRINTFNGKVVSILSDNDDDYDYDDWDDDDDDDDDDRWDQDDQKDKNENKFWYQQVTTGQFKSLPDAIKEATQRIRGTAFSAEFDYRGMNSTYEVKVFHRGHEREIDIRARQ